MSNDHVHVSFQYGCIIIINPITKLLFSHSSRITNLLDTFLPTLSLHPSLFISRPIFLGWDSLPCLLAGRFQVSNFIFLTNYIFTFSAQLLFVFRNQSNYLLGDLVAWRTHPTIQCLWNIARPYLSILCVPRELFPRGAKCETCSTGKWVEGFARMDL